ncbi:MAG: glycoside hydrolase family 16 protein [Lysobacteraceae bacterium]|jgi:beta-glucanase (GH16 family)|nr:MAG: glycoside hydrolase family 16 protein [Xanthomonadaceae bacterium]
MRSHAPLFAALPLLFAVAPGLGLVAQDETGAAAAPSVSQARFEQVPAWRDEFEYVGLPDPRLWNFERGGHGWGNNELQYYAADGGNALVADGVLTIVARKQSRKDRAYTSARLSSKGKGDFRYGRFEVRARLPAGRGTWPAIWMLPTDQAYGGWPRSGEIDIMEHVGYDPGTIHVTMHTGAYNHRIGTQRGATRLVEGATTGFHVYRTDWTPQAIRGYVDDQLVLEFPNEGSGPEAWPFDQRFHFLLNVAVGGDWGGKHGVDEAAFPARMQVDYVRVYRLLDP